MIDKWLFEEIEQRISERKRLVILDPKRECEYLFKLLDGSGHYVMLRTDNELTEDWQTVREELFLRYAIETNHKADTVIIYTARPKQELSFLFDYCYTHACIDLTDLSEWLRNKLFTKTGLQVSLSREELLIAAKESIGKDIIWWKKQLQGLEELINLDDELIPFLHAPPAYLDAKDSDIRKMFEQKICAIIDQPYIAKPATTLAEEVVRKLLDGLADNSISDSMLKQYLRWIDSDTYRPSFDNYLSNYKLSNSSDYRSAHPNHCFAELDRKALIDIVSHWQDKPILASILAIIKQRANRNPASRYVQSWMKSVITLFEYDSKPLAYSNNFDEVVNHYAAHFAKVDKAMRELYSEFLNDEAIIRPLQNYYESQNQEVLTKWFRYAGEYQSNQQGYLANLFRSAQGRVAVIVGDALRYEIAEAVADSLEKRLKIERRIMIADMPSETENNMSALYCGDNQVIAIHKERERMLTAACGKEIKYINLSELNYEETADYLVLTYKEIDSTGEKLNHSAIKLFSGFESELSDKILRLINMGYSRVYLVSDHGFVLTGLLIGSDKIEANVRGKSNISERYVRTSDRQFTDDYIEFHRPNGEYQYVYAAKSSRPFKSKGEYGFAHGGFTPQEIIIPEFEFKALSNSAPSLKVEIANRKDLSEVVGDTFAIRIKSSAGEDIFSASRKLEFKLFVDNALFCSSDIFNIEANSALSKEFSFGKHSNILAILFDAETQEQLDKAKITKSTARDFGGLL